MADSSNAETRRTSVSLAPPPPIAKDMQGLENPVPLSPQWLLPKPGESKLGLLAGESLSTLPHSSRSSVTKTSGNVEDLPNSEKKKDVFRPSVLDAEAGRRERWRDEERDANSFRRMDFWADNSSKQSADARRFQSERWNDANNKEKNVDQRRESKWNTRWGPDDKDTENWREKWSDIGKDSEGSRDKGTIHANNLAKDFEREGDVRSRPWRSNILSQPRGRGEPSPPQNIMSNRPVPVHVYGRGKGDTGTSIISPGRGKLISNFVAMNSSATMPSISTNPIDKSDADHANKVALRYNRIKLLDIYRLTDVAYNDKLLDTLSETPSLTQAKILEPLALSPPNPDETIVLKGIEKGDIVSSGAYQTSKDGSVARNTTDGNAAPGSQDDFSSSLVDYKNVNIEASDYLEQMDTPVSLALKSEGFLLGKSDGTPVKEGSIHDKLSPPPSSWRPLSINEQLHGLSSDWKGVPSEMRSRPLDIVWTHLPKERENELRSMTMSPNYTRDLRQPITNFLSETSGNMNAKGHQSGFMDREKVIPPDESLFVRDMTDVRKSQIYKSPEDMSFYYRDPQGQIQGPFSGADLIGWFEAGYFGIDLQVRLVDAPHDSPFVQLGDVMPHLRMKSRPPPGFNTSTPVDPEMAFREKILSPVNAHSGFGDLDMTTHGLRNRAGFVKEAENKFLESLMGSSSRHEPFPIPISEGIKGYMPPVVGGESSSNSNYLLAQMLLLEQQRAFPNNPAYWVGREGLTVPRLSKPDAIPEPPAAHPETIPQVQENRQFSQSQQLDLLSILQKGTGTSAVNLGNHGWPANTGVQSLNSAVHSGMNILQSIDPQQRFQQQNQLPLSNVATHSVERSSSLIPPEALLSSGISEDPQLIALLQQQYLLSQLQLQTPAVPSQLSVLDKILLLNQQQKQEQQLILQQQQQILSHVLSERQSIPIVNESSFGLPHGPATGAGFPGHHFEGMQTHGGFPIASQISFQNQLDLPTANLNKFPLNVSGDVSAVSSKQFCDPDDNKDSNALYKHEGASHTGDLKSASEMPEDKPLSLPENIDLHQEISNAKTSDLCNNSSVGFSTSAEVKQAQNNAKAMVSETCDLVTSMSELANNLNISSGEISKSFQVELPTVGETKTTEGREIRKASEKKMKKPKNSKVQLASESAKKGNISQQLKQSSLIEESPAVCLAVKSESEASDSTFEKSTRMVDVNKFPVTSADETEDNKNDIQSKNSFCAKVETINGSGDGNSTLTHNLPASNLMAWKAAPGFKPKSLVEIQQEEQRRAQTEKTFDFTGSSQQPVSQPSAWVGLVANSDNKSSREALQDGANTITGAGSVGGSKSRKSQLHDLLAEEVLSKAIESSSDFTGNAENNMSAFSQKLLSSQVDSLPNDDFVEAKDSKKNRKKASKSKGMKTPITVSSDISTPQIPSERNKAFNQVQPEKELLPTPPAGPSLADFVPWKEDQITATPVAAWSTSSSKAQKPVSLRDILKEQEKKTIVSAPLVSQVTVPTPTKATLNRNTPEKSSSWQMPGSSPSKGMVSSKTTSCAASSKSRNDDELFWGPLDHTKHESKPEFPSLLTSNSSATKSIPVKGSQTSNQKPGGKSLFTLSCSPSNASHPRSARGTANRNSEAMDFREWCESEWVRLTGTKDTSFLEFCLKQSTSEAEMLLRENLGSLDPKHEFIDKFLDYKELLPSDVLDIAFQAHTVRKESGVRDPAAVEADMEPEGSKGSKKKVKKGKKVSPFVLGFNVVSSRIMKGEIQTVDD